MDFKYRNTLFLDIDRVLARPMSTPYEKASIPFLMERFRNYQKGKIQNIRKWEIWQAYNEIASLYNMRVIFNRRTRMVYFRVLNAPVCFACDSKCLLTYVGSYSFHVAEARFYECINETIDIFIRKYKGNSVFDKSINAFYSMDLIPPGSLNSATCAN